MPETAEDLLNRLRGAPPAPAAPQPQPQNEPPEALLERLSTDRSPAPDMNPRMEAVLKSAGLGQEIDAEDRAMAQRQIELAGGRGAAANLDESRFRAVDPALRRRMAIASVYERRFRTLDPVKAQSLVTVGEAERFMEELAEARRDPRASGRAARLNHFFETKLRNRKQSGREFDIAKVNDELDAEQILRFRNEAIRERSSPAENILGAAASTVSFGGVETPEEIAAKDFGPEATEIIRSEMGDLERLGVEGARAGAAFLGVGTAFRALKAAGLGEKTAMALGLGVFSAGQARGDLMDRAIAGIKGAGLGFITPAVVGKIHQRLAPLPAKLQNDVLRGIGERLAVATSEGFGGIAAGGAARGFDFSESGIDFTLDFLISALTGTGAVVGRRTEDAVPRHDGLPVRPDERPANIKAGPDEAPRARARTEQEPPVEAPPDISKPVQEQGEVEFGDSGTLKAEAPAKPADDLASFAEPEVAPEVGIVGEQPGGTSIKNRVVNRERLERGVGPMAEPIRRKWGDVVDKALDVVTQNPQRPHELVLELAAKPRPMTDVEGAILDIHRVNLHKARKTADADGIAAQERGDAEAVADAKARASLTNDAFMELEKASKRGGTETARALAFRRAVMAEDFSLLAMETRRRAENDYKPLTPEQASETKALHEKLAKAISERDAHAARAAELESLRGVEEVIEGPPAKTVGDILKKKTPSPKSKRYGASNKIFTRDAYDKAKAEFLRPGTGALGADKLEAAILIGGYHLEAGSRKFANWSKAMVSELGEAIEPHLKSIWDASRGRFSGELRGDAATKIREGLAEGRPLEGMQRQIGAIAEGFIASGITKREPLIDAVHGVLRHIDPKISRRETMDAISGYGRLKTLDDDPIKAELRELKGQMQQVAKLEDMARGDAPLKTGFEQQAPGDIQRELIREVNKAKREGGFSVTDPKRQIQSALQSVKTRLKNQISDLDKAIKSGKRFSSTRGRSKVELDAEAAELRDRRDELRKQHDEIFGKKEMSDEKRVEVARKAVQRSIDDLERRIGEGDLFPDRPESKTPITPELEALRLKRDILREDLKDLQDDARPPATPEERALKAMKRRMRKRIAEIQERLANEDFAPRPKKPPVAKDDEAVRLEAELDVTKRAWNEALVKDRLKNRSRIKKVMDAAFVQTPNTARAIISSLDLSAVLRQGGFLSVARPFRAARAFPSMFRALRSEAGQARVEAELRQRPSFPDAQRAGLFLAEHKGQTLSKMEEAYMSRWAEKIPLVAASQRAYETFLNRLRMDTFDAMSASMSRTDTPTPKEAEAIAGFINVATGRGSFKNSNAMSTLSTVFWSPRLVASRFQLAAGQPMIRGSMRTRKAIAAEYARSLMGLGIIYGLGKMAGGEIEEDPKSSDFGKIRFGNTRVDPMAGLSQVTVFAERLRQEKKKTLSGKIVPLTQDAADEMGVDLPFRGDTPFSIGTRFLRTKLSPVLGAAINLKEGENVVGEKVSPLDLVNPLSSNSMVAPLAMRDVFDSMQEQGVPKGTALGLLAIFGMGIHNFEVERKKVRKRRRRRRKK